MFEKISFPEYEYGSIQNYLKKLGYCYTTRVYKELGKYKVGELYAAPWDIGGRGVTCHKESIRVAEIAF